MDIIIDYKGSDSICILWFLFRDMTVLYKHGNVVVDYKRVVFRSSELFDFFYIDFQDDEKKIVVF